MWFYLLDFLATDVIEADTTRNKVARAVNIASINWSCGCFCVQSELPEPKCDFNQRKFYEDSTGALSSVNLDEPSRRWVSLRKKVRDHWTPWDHDFQVVPKRRRNIQCAHQFADPRWSSICEKLATAPPSGLLFTSFSGLSKWSAWAH